MRKRDLYHQASSQQERQVLKGTRWLPLKNPENLDEGRDELHRLAEALRLNEPLAVAGFLKRRPAGKSGRSRMKPHGRGGRCAIGWPGLRASGIRDVGRQFAATLEEHQEGVLNYYRYPISTGPLEGTNNKIKTMKRQAYGFRDHAFFKLKILGIHETKHALVG